MGVGLATLSKRDESPRQGLVSPCRRIASPLGKWEGGHSGLSLPRAVASVAP